MNSLSSSLVASLFLLLNVILIIFLVQRTLLSGLEHHTARRLRRVLNIALVPLIVIFAYSVVRQITSEQTGAFIVAARNEPTTRPAVRSLPTVIVGNVAIDVADQTATPATPDDTIAAVPQPTGTASAVAQEATPTAANQFATDSFDATDSGWLVRTTDSWSAGYSEGRYQLTLDGQPNIAVSSAVSASNYEVTADVTARTGAAGLVFLSSEPASFYYFLIRNGMFSIQRHDQDRDGFISIVDWTQDASIRSLDNEANELQVRRSGTTIQFFANDALLSEWTPPPGRVNNQYGFVLVADDGQGFATFDNLIGVQQAAQ